RGRSGFWHGCGQVKWAGRADERVRRTRAVGSPRTASVIRAGGRQGRRRVRVWRRGRAAAGVPRPGAASRTRRDSGRDEPARYRAEEVPVSWTGRLLSLEQVPTSGSPQLMNWRDSTPADRPPQAFFASLFAFFFCMQKYI